MQHVVYTVHCTFNMYFLYSEGKVCWVRVYSLPTDRSRPETSVCTEYPGKVELKKISGEVDSMEEMEYGDYGAYGIIIFGLIGKFFPFHRPFSHFLCNRAEKQSDHRRTDGPTDTVTYGVASLRLKTKYSNINMNKTKQTHKHKHKHQ